MGSAPGCRRLRRATKDRLLRRILEEIDRSQGRVGIAASTLNIEKIPPIELRVADEIRVHGARS